VIDINSEGKRGHSCSSKRPGAKGYCKVFFSNKVINRWNELDKSAVDTHSINAFKNSLEKVRNNRMSFFMYQSADSWALLVDDWPVRPYMVSYMVSYVRR